MNASPKKRVSIIAPCYNEAGGLDEFLAQLRTVTDALPAFDFEFILVDDGSTDDTEELLARRAGMDPRVKAVFLARNYGHQRAITAGLDLCSGDYAIILDADLQDPPELIPEILDKLEEGFDVVHTVRADRSVDSFGKRAFAKICYWGMRRWVLPELRENAGEFKGMNRRILDALKNYRERVRFLRGAIATLGFRQTEIVYNRAKRYEGTSKYPTWQTFRLARDAMVSNTVIPLRFGFYFGVAVLFFLPLYLLSCVAAALRGIPPNLLLILGLLGVIAFFSSLILILLGLIGEYLMCIIREVKQRPLYIVRATQNLPLPDPPPGD
jgi:polyisoprenyl-phosphate glycosyltransferase